MTLLDDIIFRKYKKKIAKLEEEVKVKMPKKKSKKKKKKSFKYNVKKKPFGKRWI